MSQRMEARVAERGQTNYKFWTGAFWRELFRPKTKQEFEKAQRESIWIKPDRIDIFSFFLITIFFIAIFQNVTFLSSADLALREFAIRNLAVASLGASGLALKALFDNATIRKDNERFFLFVTSTDYDQTTVSSVLFTFLWFAVAFAGQFIASLVFGLFTLSAFAQEELVFAIIGSVSEELFFSLALQSVLTSRLKIVGIPIVIIIFAWYHAVIYSATTLIYILIVRSIYSIVYFVSRRFSAVTIAHLINNMLSVGAFI